MATIPGKIATSWCTVTPDVPKECSSKDNITMFIKHIKKTVQEWKQTIDCGLRDAKERMQEQIDCHQTPENVRNAIIALRDSIPQIPLDITSETKKDDEIDNELFNLIKLSLSSKGTVVLVSPCEDKEMIYIVVTTATQIVRSL
mgnify:CR=1 FL=1